MKSKQVKFRGGYVDRDGKVVKWMPDNVVVIVADKREPKGKRHTPKKPRNT